MKVYAIYMTIGYCEFIDVMGIYIDFYNDPRNIINRKFTYSSIKENKTVEFGIWCNWNNDTIKHIIHSKT